MFWLPPGFWGLKNCLKAYLHLQWWALEGAPVQRFTLVLQDCFTGGTEFTSSVVILSVSEPRPKLHGIYHSLFLPIFHPPFFVPFCFSITVCKAWWLQLLWKALQKIILHAHLFHLGISQGLAKWQMLMQPHVQSWHAWAASVKNLWLSPVPVLMQPGTARGAWPFCGHKNYSANTPGYPQINYPTLWYCPQLCQYLPVVMHKNYQIRNMVSVLRFHQMAL